MMGRLYSLARPVLFTIDAEKAHGLAISFLKYSSFKSPVVSETPRLKTALWSKSFPNPLGLAAGFDKNAEVIAPILSLGFGFTEVGTVTPKPQEGNPKPRIFRSPKNHAVINRMGFPNQGLEAFQANLTRYLEKKPRPNGLVGINIGMNKDTQNPLRDYTVLLRALAPMADYLTINISSPNTPGLRDHQKPEAFRKLIGTLQEELSKVCGNHPPPLLVKLAPDLTAEEQRDLAKAALDMDLDGLILANTTLARPDTLPKKFADQKGGLSGKPVFEKSNKVLRNFYKLTEGKIPLIGVGGIETAEDAYAKLRSGASLIQLYSGMIYQGPMIAKDILEGLDRLLERDGYDHVQDVTGADVPL